MSSDDTGDGEGVLEGISFRWASDDDEDTSARRSQPHPQVQFTPDVTAWLNLEHDIWFTAEETETDMPASTEHIATPSVAYESSLDAAEVGASADSDASSDEWQPPPGSGLAEEGSSPAVPLREVQRGWYQNGVSPPPQLLKPSEVLAGWLKGLPQEDRPHRTPY